MRRKMFNRILSIFLCVALLIPTIAMTTMAIAPMVTRAIPDAPTELKTISDYLHSSVSTEDNTSHLPVNVHTYYDSDRTYTPSTVGVDGTISILYVMNTNTERLGRKTDAELIQSFIDRGYFVIVLDYQNNQAATGTNLDWSVQDIRAQVIGAKSLDGSINYTSGTYTDGKLVGEDYNCAKSYILPAGYDIIYNVPYFSYDKHGVAGTFENIVEIWNNDFKSVKRNFIVKWVNEDGTPRLDRTDAITEKAPQDTSNTNYATWFKTADGQSPIAQTDLAKLSKEEQKQYQYTYVGNTKAVEVTDCVKPDGTMIDLNLYFDILYPSDYEGELPVMIAMSSAYTRTATWSGETRPHLNGAIFNGYVGVVSDYGLVPMCRNDHYGYFCGDSQLNSVSGDNGTYSLTYYNGIHSDTALLRTLRQIGAEGKDVDGYGYVSAPINPEKIGAYGNSKAGLIIRLANPTPENLEELRHYEGHKGETRLEALEGDYPYADPYISGGATTDSRIDMPEEQPALTYSNGTKIHSGLNFVFANCGGASDTLTVGSAPIFGVGTQQGGAEGSYYTYYATTANYARNLDIPFFGLVSPDLAHELGYGTDKDYGLDIYESYLKYADYWLKDESAECIIIDVDTTNDICVASDVAIDNVYEITENSSIKLQFTGPISYSEIQKVQVISLTTGEALYGEWYGSYGNQQWKFIPHDIKDATYYTVVVPADVFAENGKQIKAPVTKTFNTAYGVTDSALSVDTVVSTYPMHNENTAAPERQLGGLAVKSGATYVSYKDGGLQFNLSAFKEYNTNQNLRMYAFQDIWSDRSYIGKKVSFTFSAKASKDGKINLSLNQRSDAYVYNNYPGLSGVANLTTEWQTFTYEFTVTEAMYRQNELGNMETGPNLALGIRFTGFATGSAYDDATVSMRDFIVTASTSDANLIDNNPVFVTFKEQSFAAAEKVNLRFAVDNDAANTVGVYEVTYPGVLGTKLGEVIVTGAGLYSFDVTDYVKTCNGSATFALKIEKSIGTTVLNKYDYENGTTGIYFNEISKSTVTNTIPNNDGTPNTCAKYEYMIRSAYYIDLDGNLVSKHIGNLYNFSSDSKGVKNGTFDETDFGRRFRVTFRVYDETSRVMSVTNGNGYDFASSTADFKGTNYSFYTTAGEWTTVTYEFTIDDAMYYGDTLRKQVMIFGAENKSIAVLDEDAAVNVRNMAGATSKPGNYAGEAGLNDSYNVYNNVNDALTAGKVTYYDEFSYGLYIDDIIFEEITTSVNLSASLPMLSITPTTNYDVLPSVSGSVVANNPGATQNGLWVSGGQSGLDTESVKSYVKLSLNGYTGGYAGFLFRAMGEGKANVSVYGVSDVNAGQSWTTDSITTENAPANDIYGSGVNLNEVYGNAPLATVNVGTYENTYRVDLTSFAEYMRSKGATEITLILVSDAKNTTEIQIVDKVDESIIAKYNCVTTKPTYTAAGFNNDKLKLSSYTIYPSSGVGIEIDLRAAEYDEYKDTTNVRFEVLNDVWADRSYIGKTIRVTFSAKASEAGAIQVGLNQRQLYAFNFFDNLSKTVDLSTDWQTFTFDFEVTEAMYDVITNGNDKNGIQPPGLAFGIHFVGFNDGGKFKGAQITVRNFVISETEPYIPPEPIEVVTEIDWYDCVNKGVDFDAVGYSASSGFNKHNGQGYQLDLSLVKGANADQVAYFNIFKTIWADPSYVGKTIRFSFAAKASRAGTISLTFNQRTTKAGTTSYVNYTDFAQTVNLTTELQTFTFDFVVTQEMYDLVTSGQITKGLALGVRFTDFASDGVNYDKEQLLFKNFVINTVEYVMPTSAVALIDENVATVAEESYDRTFADVNYDFSTLTPTFNALGYSAKDASKIAYLSNGALTIKPSNDVTQGPNANQAVRLGALAEIWKNSANIGKTFTISFRARATEAGIMDFALDYSGSLGIYKGCQTQFDVSTEYRTFTYTFHVTQDMYNNAVLAAFRFYNGYVSGGKYNDTTFYIDDIRVYQDFEIEKTTLSIVNTHVINGSATDGKLSVYASNSAIKAEVKKSYFGYNLADLSYVVSANLNINLANANGETVRVYILPDTTLPANLTYANAPQIIGAAAFSFIATNEPISLDMLDIVLANLGTNIVVVFSIEHLSGDIQITATPELDIVTEHHDYSSDSQRHEAKAPTYNASGNIEFYNCAGCGKLYVKNNSGDFVEIDADDVILPPVPYSTEFSLVSLNIGTDLSVKYFVTLSEGEGIEGFSARFTLNGVVTEVATATFDQTKGKYVFSFCGVAPQLMGDTITAELLKNGQVIDEKDYSVRAYVENALELYPNDTGLKQLLADLMHYGAAAQQYIGYKTDALVTDGLGLTASSTTPTEADKHKGVSQSTNSSVQFTAAGVRFDYVNRIYVKFKANDVSNVTVSVGGVNLEILETNTAGVYIAYSDAISALRFDEVLTFTLSVNGSAVQTLTYTVNDYAYTKHSDSRISDLALALYRYGKSAREYNSSK